MDKTEIRSQTFTRLSQLTSSEKEVGSQHINEHLKTAGFLAESQTIACFSALGSEPNLTDIYHLWLAQGKTLLFPKFNGTDYGLSPIKTLSDLQPGHHNVLEPTAPTVSSPVVDLWLVPGVAFDLMGTRYGRGKGFYDRLLSNQTGLKCGICFYTQLHTKLLPREAHDIAMDVLISEKQMYFAMGF